MGNLGNDRLPGVKLFAWCASFLGLICMAITILGYGSTDLSGYFTPNPETGWPVSVEGSDPSEDLLLKIPLLISEQTLPTDSRITYSITVESMDIDGMEHPAVLLERPLHSASVTWDGLEVPMYSSHEGDPLDGDSSLLGQLPTHPLATADSHTLGVTLTGAHGYLGVASSLIIGEFSSLERSQQYGEFRLVFGATVLTVIGLILLFIGLYSTKRGEFVSAGLFSLMMGLAIFSLSDMWAIMPGGLEYRLRVRHAALALSPFFGLSALMFILQVRHVDFVKYLGLAAFLIAVASMGWPDSTILPYIRHLEMFLGVTALVYGVAQSFKHGLQGVFEARLVLSVVIALLIVWSIALAQFGMMADGSLLVLVFVGVCFSMMILLIRRYLTSSERYAQFVSEAIDAILVVDSSGNIVESNSSGRHLLGLVDQGGSATKNLFDQVEPLDIERCRKHVELGFGSRVELRFPIRSSDTSNEVTVHVESVAFGLEERLVLLVLRDVTKRRRIEDRIISAVKVETLGIVARGIAHDYNNILSAVLGQLTMLDHEIEDVDSDLIHRTERLIVETSERTRKQLATVRGANEPCRSVDPIDLIESTSQLVTGTLPDNVFLTKSFGDNLPPVYCKAVEIEQVLLNLVTNARDVLAGQKSGQIEIRASRANPGFVLFSVIDNGPVIPPEHAHMVWSPFFSSAGRDLGAGLVLSVVERVVREHGGRVEQVTPESGVGARFGVYIPVAEMPAQSEPSVSPTKFGEVLVVEDEPNIREVMVSVLRLRGFTVAQAESSEAARDKFDPRDFQLLVTDVIMARENGISLAKHFNRVNPKLAVLIVSGQVPENLPSHQAWAFLDKPFTPEMLVASARKAILLSKVTPNEAVYE